MNREVSLDAEEWDAIEALGGLESCAHRTDQILQEHGITRSLFSKSELLILQRGRHRKTQVEFNFDPGRSLHANIEDLLEQALEVQRNSSGTAYVGAMLQHLVGAKLDLVLGDGQVAHHGFSVADHSTDRKADFQVDAVAIHITTHPTEALVRKCGNNLRAGLKPVIITFREGVNGALFLLRSGALEGRVDVLDATQFLTANVYERSLFRVADCKLTLEKLLLRYNEIVGGCETDPSLRVNLGKGKS